eukprot:CAMPEP_0177438526 /NCGR_PEP_ID=MMETSP0369-20130122/2807_1 /TAXON_ID=447022 ORGANISM="Scrippsiella hangoei-like, Strain SHHI-4" /NCGR_SAMPLE_ID=MMETSP0369 /ASSEMBLY_ACC=CAM_ASM_000364 /LENGTH=188 /DNA_ID=CAMNT_0018910109 /DNA_START=45 /DNA_END=608 /DNA_ORIENTATION=+
MTEVWAREAEVGTGESMSMGAHELARFAAAKNDTLLHDGFASTTQPLLVPASVGEQLGPLRAGCGGQGRGPWAGDTARRGQGRNGRVKGETMVAAPDATTPNAPTSAVRAPVATQHQFPRRDLGFASSASVWDGGFNDSYSGMFMASPPVGSVSADYLSAMASSGLHPLCMGPQGCISLFQMMPIPPA